MMTDVDFHTHLSDQTGNYQTAVSEHYRFSEGECVCVCVWCVSKYLSVATLIAAAYSQQMVIQLKGGGRAVGMKCPTL